MSAVMTATEVVSPPALIARVEVAQVEDTTTAVARPVYELVPLIQKEINAGHLAGIEHYRRAGEMLLEAKAQVAHGEWVAWIARNFRSGAGKSLSRTTAHYYMKLANPNVQRVEHSSLREAVGIRSNAASWRRPVQKIAAQVNVAALTRDQQEKEQEQQLLRKLSHQLIDIGYKVLAAKLHPDMGGSDEAMARLNHVRKVLKEAA